MTSSSTAPVWNIDPTLWHVGPLAIRWYGAWFAIGVLLASQLGRRALEPDGVTRQQIDRLVGYIIVGTVVGARLGHCLLYEPGFYLTHPLQILFVWHGGLASHGGNFFNSEIVGRPTPLPWAIIFLRVDGQPRHPAQLYEAAFYLLTQFTVLALYRRTPIARRPGALLGTVLVMIFSFRFLVEFIKEPQTPLEARLWLDMGQLLSVPAIAAGAFLVWRARRHEEVAGRQLPANSVAS